MGIKFVGTGRFLPELEVTNDDLKRLIETSDEWIKTRTGIASRHISAWEPTWYMGAQALKSAIEKSGIDPADIGLIIATTISSDFHTPAVANVIQGKVGAVNAVSFDMNAACSGFIYGVDTARRFLETETDMKYAVVVSAENLSRVTDFSDRNTCILFGDGAAAAIIERSDTPYTSYLCTDGTGAKYLYARSIGPNKDFAAEHEDVGEEFEEQGMHKVMQNGKEVYKFAVKALPHAVNSACEKLGISPFELDYIIPHQANMRIIETAAKNLNLPIEKFITVLDHYGNTSSASIPLALDEALEKGLIKEKSKVCMVGFGAGLTLGAIIMEI